MDIHLPKVPHSWRELAKEIAIIVVGVLIALTAEQIVDDWQWRIKVDASVRSMRRELFFDDGPQVYMRAAVHPCAQAHLRRIRTAIDSGRPRSEISGLIDGYWVEYLTYDMTAHEAATASDVAVHMPSNELEAFNQVYNAIPDLDEIGKKESGDLAWLRALRRSGGPLSEYEATEIAAAVEALRIDDNDMWVSVRWSLPVMKQLGGPFDPGRISRFIGNAREHYGNCVQLLPRNWPAGVPMPKERTACPSSSNVSSPERHSGMYVCFRPIADIPCMHHTCSAGSRSLIKITLPAAYEDRQPVKDLVDYLMGRDPAKRFEFIQRGAAAVDE